MRITTEEIRTVIALHENCGSGQQLCDYLKKLDYDKVFELEVLMQFGREWYELASVSDCGYSAEAESISIMNCYTDFKAYAGQDKGKDMAIQYLTGKAILSEYLRAAMQHCNPDRITLPYEKWFPNRPEVNRTQSANSTTGDIESNAEPAHFNELQQLVSERIHPFLLGEQTKVVLKNLLRRFPYELLVECVDISYEKYMRYDENGMPTKESAIDFLNKIGGIAHNKSVPPLEGAVKHVLGRAKAAFDYWNDRVAGQIMWTYVDALRGAGWTDDSIIADLQDECMVLIRKSRNWSQWKGSMERWIEDINGWERDSEE